MTGSTSPSRSCTSSKTDTTTLSRSDQENAERRTVENASDSPHPQVVEQVHLGSTRFRTKNHRGYHQEKRSSDCISSQLTSRTLDMATSTCNKCTLSYHTPTDAGRHTHNSLLVGVMAGEVPFARGLDLITHVSGRLARGRPHVVL